MCFGDVLNALRQSGMSVSAMQLRWAINSGKITRPPLDGSLRFDFDPAHVVELQNYFRTRKPFRRPVIRQLLKGDKR